MSSFEQGRRSWLSTAGRAAAVAGTGLVLGGCGFQLRREPPLPFGSIALTGFKDRSPMAMELREALKRQVQVSEAPALAQVVLHAIVDTRERSIVAQTSAAQVRELQLRVRLQFRAHTPNGRELQLARDMSYNESIALAKQIEEGELFREMQSDIVLQVLRRLASIKV
jgi:LPS-assembly lipoprotein